MTVPNLLTVLRMALVPLVLIAFFASDGRGSAIASSLFVVAALTDWLDGFLARRLNQTSTIGAFLDPVADKLMVCSVLVAIVSMDGGLVVTLCAIIIVAREIAISALREVMANMGQRSIVAVGSVGKYKTSVQMLAIALMLLGGERWGYFVYETGRWSLIVAAVLTVWSMVGYVRAAWPVLIVSDRR